MPFSGASRICFSAALAHLSIAGALLLFDAQSEVLAARWDVLVWLLLIGFVGCATVGFSLHLFPALSHRASPGSLWGGVAYGSLEAGVVLGAAALVRAGSAPSPGALFSLGAAFVLIAFTVVLGGVLAPIARSVPRDSAAEGRPGDAISIPLFLAAWCAAVLAAGMFVVSGVVVGPGFGWQLAAVHLFVLGHATLLIAAITVRLVPRSVDTDPPRSGAVLLAVLGLTGAILVPLGMLAVPPSSGRELALLAAPEGAFGLLFFVLLVYALWAGKISRPALTLNLTAAALLLVGGSLGLYMVSRQDYAPIAAHALVNVLGFVGLTVIIMWFSMIAPFQRISHAWTRRMLWVLSLIWLGGTGLLAWAGYAGASPPSMVTTVGGGLLLGTALAWGVGTLPVLYPRLNPLPGLSSEGIRILRNRWGGR